MGGEEMIAKNLYLGLLFLVILLRLFSYLI